MLIRVSAALGRLSDFFQLNGAGAYLTVHDRQVAAIADVFTEPQSGQVLEEGVGDVLPLYLTGHCGGGKRHLVPITAQRGQRAACNARPALAAGPAP